MSRENPNVIIFVTGCGATRNPTLFAQIPSTLIIDNAKKMDLNTYISAIKTAKFSILQPEITSFKNTESKLSKQFIQIQNGCNHDCTYCVTRLLRGPAVSVPYEEILTDTKTAISKGFYEIVLTGVDTASYARLVDDKAFMLADVCENLLKDVPQMQHLRLSSIDPASPQVPRIISMMHSNPRFMPHLHLSMQSGSNTILKAMRRRHDADMLRNIVKMADGKVSFSADIICGFPGETDELFNETAELIKELKLINVHAFPFSPRPNTVAADMPNQIPHNISKKRVKIIYDIVALNRQEFMKNQIGKTVSVLVEENNTGRTPDDLEIKILGDTIPNKNICDVTIQNIEKNCFIGIKND